MMRDNFDSRKVFQVLVFSRCDLVFRLMWDLSL